ncbi:glycosyltransferase [candidate division KSB3 bacterium]|uniref:Glycosyltransferase n=1 Tax=candidate division KSB3 bacterium TaxID=2044937 RepID=A0A2G6E707_9BACT|nr:MAG: glycosyltransferase [candidate division KSB3 bacterium]PIE30260.1 MAG: glycosyltransferase [candidate division KSB3 bacterium]
MPKVSVILTNYNYAAYLPKRLDSIVQQTFQDFEVIYVDDASEDNSVEIARHYLPERSSTFIVNERNSGSPFRSWNKGVQQARGDYLWLAEADDWADPRFLAETVQIMQAHPGLGLVYCSSRIVDAQNRITGETISLTDDLDQQLWRQNFTMHGAQFCLQYLISRNVIHNASAVLIRRTSWDQAGQADENMRLAGDWLQWVKILEHADIGYTALPLNFFRTHAQSAREQVSQDFSDIVEYYQVLHYIAQHFTPSADTMSQAFEELFLRCMARRPKMSSLSHRHTLQQLCRIVQELGQYDPGILKTVLRFVRAGSKRKLKRLWNDLRREKP